MSFYENSRKWVVGISWIFSYIIYGLFIYMEVYKNRSRKSSVYAFVIGDDFIAVQFKTNGSVYRYSYTRAGRSNVETMKRLARLGLGLNTYIKNNVDKRFD